MVKDEIIRDNITKNSVVILSLLPLSWRRDHGLTIWRRAQALSQTGCVIA